MDFERAHRLAVDFGRENNLRYVDLYPEIRAAAARGVGVYYGRDMHWNSEGHALVAGVIERWMRDHCGWLRLPARDCGQ